MNDAPAFLTFSEIVEIHNYQLKNFGGSPGIRDVGLLKSALGMPADTFDGEFLHPSIFEMAAAYLFHLVKNHPFIDENKRVGTMAALVFLDMNEIEFEAPEEKLTKMVYRVASGEMFKSEIAMFFRNYCRMR